MQVIVTNKANRYYGCIGETEDEVNVRFKDGHIWCFGSDQFKEYDPWEPGRRVKALNGRFGTITGVNDGIVILKEAPGAFPKADLTPIEPSWRVRYNESDQLRIDCRPEINGAYLVYTINGVQGMISGPVECYYDG